MNFLQLASFSGNIGDNAQISGLRYSLKRHFGESLTFSDLEIRQFYQSWNELRFDREFAHFSNQNDALIIGGGGFFDMNFPYSASGTTIDISNEVFDLIEVPIVFYALGCNQLRAPAPECVDKFRQFLDNVLADDKSLVSVRNDGSYDVIEQYLGPFYAERIHEIPDPGFFFQPDESFCNLYNPLLNPNFSYLGICLAGDDPHLRYGSKSGFAESMAEALRDFLNMETTTNLIFFPHIYKDIDIIHSVLEFFPDQLRRMRVQIAPCFQGNPAEQYIFSLYRKCELIISNRFHGVVVPISLGIPAVAFCDHATRKVAALMDKINLPEFKYSYRENLDDFAHFIRGLFDQRHAFYRTSSRVLSDLKCMNDNFLNLFSSSF